MIFFFHISYFANFVTIAHANFIPHVLTQFADYVQFGEGTHDYRWNGCQWRNCGNQQGPNLSPCAVVWQILCWEKLQPVLIETAADSVFFLFHRRQRKDWRWYLLCMITNHLSCEALRNKIDQKMKWTIMKFPRFEIWPRSVAARLLGNHRSTNI